MKIANVKGMVAKLMMTGLATGAFMAVNPATAQAQQFAVGVQLGHRAYVVDHDGYRYADRDGYRADRDDFRRREEFARRQAYLQHERWEHEQWEHAHLYDRPYGYR